MLGIRLTPHLLEYKVHPLRLSQSFRQTLAKFTKAIKIGCSDGCALVNQHS